MIELDGSVGEGGGQILRTALALSMCTAKPLRITRIRAKRPKPGLMRQHLACVNAAVAVSSAKVQGAELGSTTLVFEPGAVRAGDHRFAVGTAGSCSLVLQTVLPALMLVDSATGGASRVELAGGTHNPMAPPFHFLDRCFAPLLRRMGVGLDLELRRLGFYPAGGGAFVATITPPADGAFAVFDVNERGAPVDRFAECLAPGLPPRVAARELAALGEAMGWPRDALRTPPVRQNEGPGNALMATLVHEHVTEVVTAFGEKGVTSEAVAQTVERELRAYVESTGALGPHLADQWMLPLALAIGRHGGHASYTCTEMTGHARTNIGTIEAFLPVRFDVMEQGAGCWRVTVTGATGTRAEPP
jgi:RNA 3'-terminal phosphate cyclase (ATP)